MRALAATCAGALGAVAFAFPPPLDGNLFVTEEQPGNVLEYDGPTGAFYQTFALVPPPRALMAIHTGGPSGDVLVGSAVGGVRLFDRNSGALLQTFNPGGGWQWAGVWAPNGDVLIGSMATNDIRRYDATTGALLGVFAPGVTGPSDMRWGPNGNLFVCSFIAGGVFEIDVNTGAIVGHHAPAVVEANDILFMPDGRRIITSMRNNNNAWVFDASWNFITTFAGTGWGRPHGIDLSPHDGNIYAIDGVTQAVHVFDPVTYAELNANFLQTATKPVDIEFRPPIPAPGVGAVLALGLAAQRRRCR